MVHYGTMIVYLATRYSTSQTLMIQSVYTCIPYIHIHICHVTPTRSDDTTCTRREAGRYCIGDGDGYACGRCDPPQAGNTCGRMASEHSFGAADTCVACPDGWVSGLILQLKQFRLYFRELFVEYM